jgi:hypothetical protein
MEAIPKNILILNEFGDRLGLFPQHMALVYGFARPEPLSTSKVSCTWSPTTNDWRLWFPNRIDSILSLHNFLTQTGSHLVDTLHLCPKGFRDLFCGCQFCSSQIPSVIPIPRDINTITVPFLVQLGMRGFRVFTDYGSLACRETHCPSRVVIYCNLDPTYWDVPTFIPSLINNGNRISWKPKEVQVSQLRVTRSPSVLYLSGSTLEGYNAPKTYAN